VRRAHRARPDQLDDSFERRAGAADGGPQRGHIVAIGLRRLRAGRDKGGAAAGPEHREGFLHRLAADHIEDGITIADHADEILRVVVDDLVGAEAAHIVEIPRAGGDDDAGADVLGELNGETRDPAGAAANENRLAALKLQRRLEGHHFTQAGITDAAIEWWGKAGDQSSKFPRYHSVVPARRCATATSGDGGLPSVSRRTTSAIACNGPASPRLRFPTQRP
jgi:hypothetical protein